MIELKERDNYINKLLQYKDSEVIKIITGIRRSGKSKILLLYIEELKELGIIEDNIVFINFESIKYDYISDYKTLYEYVEQNINNKDKTYLFFDEIEKVAGWEKAINSFRVDFNVDIYITGSNSNLLSSEISTLISGRYVEIKMYPLSYKEFLSFYDKDNNNSSFQTYLKYGGFPGLREFKLNQEIINEVLEGIYNTVIVKDVLARNDIKDEPLLQKMIRFIADNIGNQTSSNSIANSLVSYKRLANITKAPASMTVENYINALQKAFIFYEVVRYDIKGREYLKTLTKNYIVDIGLRNMLLGYRDLDTGHILENVVYLELLRRDYKVSIGKIGDKEVDFLAIKANEKIYIQVSETIKDQNTLKRELASLKEINDNYEKWLITSDESFVESYDGIKVKNILTWLCE